MVGEEKILRKRKSSSNRPRTAGIVINNHDDSKSSDTSVFEVDKNHEFNKTKKSVLFLGKGDRNGNTQTELQSRKENRISISAAPLRSKTRLQSAKSYRSNGNGIVPSLNLDSDLQPRAGIRQRRSVSAHPALRTQTSVTSSTSKPVLTRTPSKSCLSSRNSYYDDQSLSSRSSNRNNRHRVERLKTRSPSTESLDSDDYSPRLSPGSASQPLSPEALASLTYLAQQNRQAWDLFSNHVKLIDDSTSLISRNPRKTFGSSSVFQKAMSDLYGNSEYGKTRGFLRLRGRVGAIASCASKLLAGARRVNAEFQAKAAEEEGEDFVDLDMDIEGPSKETVENAKRGWRLLRQYVQEMAAEKRMSQSSLTWGMLKHALRGLTNMERTRYELYQKYGLVPMVLSDGTVIQENTMLSERTRSAMAAAKNNHNNNNAYNNVTVRPTTRPLRHQSASVLLKREPYRAIGGFKASSMRAETP